MQRKVRSKSCLWKAILRSGEEGSYEKNVIGGCGCLFLHMAYICSIIFRLLFHCTEVLMEMEWKEQIQLVYTAHYTFSSAAPHAICPIVMRIIENFLLNLMCLK